MTGRLLAASLASLLLAACGTDTIVAVRGTSQTSSPGTGGQSSVPPSDAPDVPPPSGPFRTDGHQIVDAGGKVVHIRALSWSGFETREAVVQGLWARPLNEILTRIKALGFNTLRLPFSSEFLTGVLDSQPQAHTNPDLVGLTGLQTFAEVIKRAGDIGLKVILVHHRSSAAVQRELWHTPEYPDSVFMAQWQRLAAEYKESPHVFAFELHCDLRGPATWGDGNPDTDWHAAAERTGNAILSVNPKLLIIVNGVQTAAGAEYLRGGNLSAVRDDPVELKVPGRVVYGAADYPLQALVENDGNPAAYTWLNDPSYPTNLGSVWEARWGYLARERIAPVVLTSFGTRYDLVPEKQWLNALVPYVKGLDLGFAYWTLNPSAVGTDGLLDNDFDSLKNPEKYAALEPLLRP